MFTKFVDFTFFKFLKINKLLINECFRNLLKKSNFIHQGKDRSRQLMMAHKKTASSRFIDKSQIIDLTSEAALQTKNALFSIDTQPSKIKFKLASARKIKKNVGQSSSLTFAFNSDDLAKNMAQKENKSKKHREKEPEVIALSNVNECEIEYMSINTGKNIYNPLNSTLESKDSKSNKYISKKRHRKISNTSSQSDCNDIAHKSKRKNNGKEIKTTAVQTSVGNPNLNANSDLDDDPDVIIECESEDDTEMQAIYDEGIDDIEPECQNPTACTSQSDEDDDEFIPMGKLDYNYNIHIGDDAINGRRNLNQFRLWDLTDFGQKLFQNPVSQGSLFTVISYNVLAQELIENHMELYRNVEPQYLEWKYRWTLFQHEISDLNPDILSLQEVQDTLYHDHYKPWFRNKGYVGRYKKRTGSKCDGCAIFYKKDKFKEIEHAAVQYYQTKCRSLADRDNVGLILKLTPLDKVMPFCVCTTHLLYNPRRVDIKVTQLMFLLTELDRICYVGEEHGKPQYCPVILSGDFNAEPYSPPLRFMKNGSIRLEDFINRSQEQFGLIASMLNISNNCQHTILAQSRQLEKQRGEIFSIKDKRKLEEELIKLEPYNTEKLSSSITPSITPINSSISHAFNFFTAYKSTVRGYNNARAVTTFQDYWVTVDYLFYTKKVINSQICEGDLKLIATYGLLSASQANRVGHLPSAFVPSDHYPLAAQFFLKY